MRNRMKDRARRRDSRAKDKRFAKYLISLALGKTAKLYALLAVLVLPIVVGCTDVTDIIIDVEPTEDSSVWMGNVRGQVDGREFSGEFTLNIKPTTTPDPGIPIVPVVEPDPLEALPDPVETSLTVEVSIPNLVWVTTSGGKFHWHLKCRYTGARDGEWVPSADIEKEACKICTNHQFADEDV